MRRNGDDWSLSESWPSSGGDLNAMERKLPLQQAMAAVKKMNRQKGDNGAQAVLLGSHKSN